MFPIISNMSLIILTSGSFFIGRDLKEITDWSVVSFFWDRGSFVMITVFCEVAPHHCRISEESVNFGKKLYWLLPEHAGQISLSEAAEAPK